MSVSGFPHFNSLGFFNIWFPTGSPMFHVGKWHLFGLWKSAVFLEDSPWLRCVGRNISLSKKKLKENYDHTHNNIIIANPFYLRVLQIYKPVILNDPFFIACENSVQVSVAANKSPQKQNRSCFVNIPPTYMLTLEVKTILFWRNIFNTYLTIPSKSWGFFFRTSNRASSSNARGCPERGRSPKQNLPDNFWLFKELDHYRNKK